MNNLDTSKSQKLTKYLNNSFYLLFTFSLLHTTQTTEAIRPPAGRCAHRYWPGGPANRH